MTAPAVDHSGSGTPAANTTTYTVTFPGGAPASGDLLIVIMGLDDNPTVNAKTGWTELVDAAGASNNCHIFAAYRVADGTEGTTVAFTLSLSNGGGWACYVISGYTGTPEVSSVATGTSGSADPPSLAPSWGSADTLWIAAMAHDGNWGVSGYPSGYSNTLEGRWANAEGAGCGTATKATTASSEDPGTFSGSNDQWGAITIAVQGTASVTGRSFGYVLG